MAQLAEGLTDPWPMGIAKTLLIGLSFTLIAACGTSTLDEIEAAKDKLCACKDKACAIKVKNDHKHLREKAKDMTNEDKLKAMKFGKQAEACFRKL